MLVIKDVKVHEDTHTVLKFLKAQNRSKSMDEVIRDLVRKGTGRSVEQYSQQKKNAKLTSFLK
jgi:tRNA/tmRNA/rRNA uracil-C5-methylase (TrmA/RlmC/RlmD family)